MTRRSYLLAEVAEMTGVSEKTLRREVREGHLRARLIRGKKVVLAADLDRYMDGLPDAPSMPQRERTRTSAPQTQGRVQRLIDVTEIVS